MRRMYDGDGWRAPGLPPETLRLFSKGTMAGKIKDLNVRFN